MKLTFLKILLTTIIFLTSNIVFAHTWSSSDATFSYNECTGYATVRLLYFSSDCGACDDDYLDGAQFYFEENGSWKHFADVNASDNDCRDVSLFVKGGYTVTSSTSGSCSSKKYINVSVRLPNSFLLGGSVRLEVRGKAIDDATPDTEFIYTSSALSIPNLNPPQITTISQSEYCDKIIVNWSKPSFPCNDESKQYYNIRWKSSTSTTFSEWMFLTGSGSRTSFEHEDLELGSSYEYELRTGLDLVGPDPRSNPSGSSIVGTTKDIPPSASNFVASDDRCDNTIRLSWDFLLGAEQIEITRGNVIIHTSENGTITSYIDNDLENIDRGVYYDYKIRAQNECGWGAYTPISQGISPDDPAKPTDINAAVQPNGTVILTWPTTDLATEYKIERSLLGGGGSSFFTVDAPTTTYTDESLVECERYEYRLFAVNACEEDGVQSDSIAKVIIEPNFSNTFLNGDVDASKGYYSDRVELTWNPTNNNNAIESYKIYRKILGAQDDSVLIASENSGANLYIDNLAEAGELYEYFIIGETQCVQNVVQTNIESAIGFRRKTGLVTGNVSYEGGTAVPNVKISADDPSNTVFSSLEFATGESGTIDHNSNMVFTDALIAEAWIKPTNHTSNRNIIQKASAFSLGYNNSGGVKKYEFSIETSTSGMFTVGIDKNIITENEWSHIAGVFQNDSLYLFINGILKEKEPVTIGAVVATSTDPIILGDDFIGKMKEIRIWNGEKTENQILRDHSRFLAGNESNLVLYLNAGERRGNYAYDLSRTGNSFHRNHALLSHPGMWSATDSPSKEQLNIAAFTNQNGNYSLVVPYAGSGQNFVITPSLGTHVFNPPNPSLPIGDASSVHSAFNFIDESSFRVTGQVLFDGTDCPSKDVFLKIDGEIKVQNGQPVRTDSEGNFDMQVPIGPHVIELERNGHVFSAGRFPPDENSLWDFQENITGIEFSDSTLRKVIGRVVGGPIEAEKVPGLGRSVNNIGVANLTFDPTSNCGWKIEGMPTRLDTTISTNTSTGEYEILLPPLQYTVSNPDFNHNPEANTFYNGSSLENIDLTNLPVPLNASDTTEIGGVEIVENVEYHKQHDYIFRAPPSIDVMNAAGDGPFETESAYTFSHTKHGTQEITPLSDYFTHPVLFQNKEYQMKISTFEQYINYDAGPGNEIEDRVPVRDGILEIFNNLSSNGDLRIDFGDDPAYDGDTLYTFNAGNPNITINGLAPEYSYTDLIEIHLKVGVDGVTEWLPVEGPFAAGRTGHFRAHVLGTRDIEQSDFVVQGPEMVDYILRDPPGSQSYAEREIGNTTSTETSFEWNLGASIDLNLSLQSGVKFTTGIGFETDNDLDNENSVGLNISTGLTRNKTMIETVTNTESWMTSDQPLFAGPASDLFIGTSKSYTFGVATSLIIVPNSVCGNNTTISCFGDDSQMFRLATQKDLAIAPVAINTSFFLSTNKIETDEIPDLEQLRNSFLSNHPKYVSMLAADHPCFGLNNDDQRFGTSECPSTPGPSLNRNSGPSYHFTQDTISIDTSYLYNTQTTLIAYNVVRIDTISIDTITAPRLTIDSIRQFNNQIQLWVNALEQNEREKIEASYEENRAFGGAAGSVTSSKTNTLTTISQREIELQFEESLKLSIGFEVGGTGFNASYGMTLTQSLKTAESQSFENTSTVSYTLADDSEWDDFQVGIAEGSDRGGPMFRIDAGRSSCPHEGPVVSKYYEPGTVISSGSIQLEQPEILITPSVLYNVPQDETAVFTMELRNNNQVGEGWEYATQLINTTNPNSAAVNVGSSDDLTNTWVIPAQASISRDIFVEIGSVYDYDSLLVVLHSTCQYQQGLSEERDIVDSAYFSVHFIPECTDIELSSPGDQFVLNNFFNDTLEIIAEGYDINYLNLDNLVLEYKPSNQNDWINLETYYYDTTGMNDPDAKMIDRGNAFTYFQWNVENIEDGTYDIRAVTDCQVADKPSEVQSGYFDRIDPHAFGTPSPADGILDPNDDISIKFNEIVDIGFISSGNIDVRGVLNGSELRHQESIAFDGISSYSEIPEYNLSKRSFTIDFWAKRNSLGKQFIFSQGLDSGHQINIGFDSDDRALFVVGDRQLKSDDPIPNDEKWRHFTFIYDRENSKANIIVRTSNTTTTDNSPTFTSNFTGAGNIYLGKSSSGNSFHFDGFLHELRIWSKVLTENESGVIATQSLSGREIGLIGNWPMDEAWGTIAKDKVRGRHATLYGASWSILPKGNAYHFDESGEYLSTNQGFAFGIETDLTFEFWFKGQSNGQRMSILSNGKADGSGSLQGAWDIFFNTSGNLVLENDGNQVSTDINHLDNSWHHFSGVINRLGNASLYIDGQLVKSSLATNFLDFGGPRLWIGARGYFDGAIEMTDNHFTGYIDDIRIWNLARNSEQINRDFVNGMSGDEPGLVVYYPFDNYVELLGVPSLNPSLMDQSMNAYDLQLRSGTTSYSQQTAPIKLARPVKKVNYTYSVNQDEIIISLNDDPALIENVTLDITVSGIRDLAGNYMQAPRTWIAYIDKNQVFWNEEYMEFEKMEGDPLSFEAHVRNSGGASQSYVIGNLPEWLSASPSSGVIDPNSSLKITFTVDPLMDIGEFTQDIYVTGDFGYNEKLVLDLKNIAAPPEWEVNHGDFAQHMNITGILKINDVISIDEDDMVAAFINDQLAGVSNLIYFEDQAIALVFMTVSMNNPSSDTLQFRVWDASEGREISDVLPNDIVFQNGDVIGDVVDPVVFNARALTRLTYHLDPGWNWISFPNTGDVLSDATALFHGLDLVQNDDISGPTDVLYDRVDANGDWLGLFSEAQVEYGYKMYVKNGGTFTYDGIFENPEDHVIDISTDWTWIGMIAEQNMDITTALASLDPQNGDIIKNLSQFAVYNDLFGWVGNLTTLVPQEGYQIKLNAPDQLIYPSSLNTPVAPFAARSEALTQQLNLELVNELLVFDKNQYAHNMNMIAKIDSCHLGGSYDMWHLVALSDGQTKGVAPVEFDSDMNAYMAYLTIHGEGNENIEFTLVKGDMSQQVLFIENETFANNQVLGSPIHPFDFGCISVDPDCPTLREVSAVDMLVAKAQSKYSASIRLSSSAIISGQRSVEFSAGREVILENGFEVQPLSSILINIQNCPE